MGLAMKISQPMPVFSSLASIPKDSSKTRSFGLKEPRYEFHPLETKIIFDSPIQENTFIEIDDISGQLNERQKNALFHVEKNGKIATREYVEINRVSRQTAHAELRDLTNKGLFTMTGKGRGTRYVRKVTD